jgi:lysophospholipase L1-like esterase
MNVPRIFTSLACTATIAGTSLVAASPASAAGAEYVALGDSYSSGVGAGNLDGSSCQRSTNAYPSKWAAAHSPASFKFVACSGATTTDVLNNQVGALSPSTTLASITVGGNDAGFSDVMQTCVLQSDSSCLSAVASAESFMDDQLPGRLGSLFSTMRSKAPNAHVTVLDYPHLYIADPSFCAGLSNTKRNALNGAADHLDAAVGKATASAGFDFADVRSQFAGHELCSGDDWLHAVTILLGDSYHPTALGHASGYLPVFSSHTGSAATSSKR